MKAFSAELTPLPLPPGHRFPIGKYSLLRQKVANSGLIAPDELIMPELASKDQLLLVHTPDYVQRVFDGNLTEKEIRRTGLPWSAELVLRARRAVGGTIAACRAALGEGLAANLAGGTHHAYPDHGEGYCVFNDVAVAARVMQQERQASRIVMIDCAVHQGNGTASIFAGDQSVYTFSIHGQRNFPYHKEISDLDVGLEDQTGDQAYLEALQPALETAILAAKADLAIYIAGVDPFFGDVLGRMALTKEGLAGRDRLVFEHCREAGLPVAVVMGGGYARSLEDITDIHLQTISLAVQAASKQ